MNKMELDKKNIERKSTACPQTDDITAGMPSRVISNQILEHERELKSDQNSTTEESSPPYGDRDILNGRGIIRHIANRVFRIFIDLHIHEYFHTQYRDEKSRIIEECLYDLIVAGYRFWNQNQQGGMVEQDLSACRAKVGLHKNRKCVIVVSYLKLNILNVTAILLTIATCQYRIKIAHAMRDRSAILKSKTVAIRKTKQQLKDEGINAIKFAELMADRSPRSNLLYVKDVSPPATKTSPTMSSQSNVTQQNTMNFQAQKSSGDKNDDDSIGSQSCVLLNGDVASMNGASSNSMKTNMYPNQPPNQSVIVFNSNGNSSDNGTSSTVVQSNRTTPLQTPILSAIIANNNCSNNTMFMINTSTVYDMPSNPVQQCSIPIQGPNVVVVNNNNSSSNKKNNILFFRDVNTTSNIPSNGMQQNTISFQNQNAVVANSNSGVPLPMLAHHPYSLIFSGEKFLHRSKALIPYLNFCTNFQQSEIIPFPQGGTMGTIPMPFLNPCQEHQNDPLISKSTETSHQQTLMPKVVTDNAVTDNAASKRNTTDSTNSNETLWSLSPIELCIKMQSTE